MCKFGYLQRFLYNLFDTSLICLFEYLDLTWVVLSESQLCSYIKLWRLDTYVMIYKRREPTYHSRPYLLLFSTSKICTRWSFSPSSLRRRFPRSPKTVRKDKKKKRCNVVRSFKRDTEYTLMLSGSTTLLEVVTVYLVDTVLEVNLDIFGPALFPTSLIKVLFIGWTPLVGRVKRLLVGPKLLIFKT